MKKFLWFLLGFVLGLCVSGPTDVKAAVKETDWKTEITPEIVCSLDYIFEHYEEPKTMYATTGVNKRVYPNILSESVEVLKRNTEVTAVADFNGWTRIVDTDENGEERYYYIWNQYLSDEKQNESYLGHFKLTAYCNCSSCCGKWSGGPTASGAYPVPGRTVAMGGIPFGTKLLINGHVYTVEDRGTPYGHVDIYFGSHGEANAFGMKYADVYVVQ